MKKKILILSIFAFLIMLSTPMITNIQAEKQSNDFTDENISTLELGEEKNERQSSWVFLFFGVSNAHVFDETYYPYETKVGFDFGLVIKRSVTQGTYVDVGGHYNGMPVKYVRYPSINRLESIGGTPILIASK